jgi:hypothetical protein
MVVKHWPQIDLYAKHKYKKCNKGASVVSIDSIRKLDSMTVVISLFIIAIALTALLQSSS